MLYEYIIIIIIFVLVLPLRCLAKIQLAQVLWLQIRSPQLFDSNSCHHGVSPEILSWYFSVTSDKSVNLFRASSL
jgi:hypothetical protein